VPNPANIRTWTDKTGSFKVEAEFITVSDGKVQLHKVNGVRIGVPVEKMSVKDMDFIRSLPGQSHVSNSNPSGAVRPPPSNLAPNKSASKPVETLADKEKYMYNGFDWRDFMIKAGIVPSDAAVYAEAFVREKMDKTIVHDIERETLRGLGMSEGDIIRLRKYAVTPLASRLIQSGNVGFFINISRG
jgi:actin cytoskeleton-regulatory complex protein SLA1